MYNFFKINNRIFPGRKQQRCFHFILNNPGLFKQTKARTLNLNELIQNDTLGRSINSFDRLYIEFRSGYISVDYKFSESRDNNITLINMEQENSNCLKWNE